jgi:sec-independent protein translocase protein TatA
MPALLFRRATWYQLTNMFGLSLGHLVILTFVVLLFGHRRLPELGHALGKGLGAFKRGLEGRDADEQNPRIKG